MSRIKDLWEEVALEEFGAVTSETLERAKPIVQDRFDREFQGCDGCQELNCWECLKARVIPQDRKTEGGNRK